MAPHHWLCIAIIGFMHIPLVWVAIVLSVPKAMREARFQDKTNIVPTPYFLFAFVWELVSIIFKEYGKNFKERSF